VSLFRLAALALLMHAAPAFAQDEPEDFPEPGAVLVDPDFKVDTREFGLDRRVEMYQWRATDSGYERVWHGALIDSDGFAAGHENPPGLLLDNRRWWAEKPTLDGKRLDPAVLRSLGEWRVLRPNFSRLPANLAASFQPEGEGLGSAENPLDPADRRSARQLARTGIAAARREGRAARRRVATGGRFQWRGAARSGGRCAGAGIGSFATRLAIPGSGVGADRRDRGRDAAAKAAKIAGLAAMGAACRRSCPPRRPGPAGCTPLR
jgi:hypothetical protein